MKRFFQYVEIKTKITSVFAFLYTLAYLFYAKQAINWKLTLLFFCSMFVFDLTTTAINNYIDSKTNQQPLQFHRRTAFYIIIVLFFISMLTGLYLAYLTDGIVLLLGALCFLFGVLYTYGPLPLSRQPLGELYSGVFYGLLIPFLLLYINMPAHTYFTLAITSETIHIGLNLMPILKVLLLATIPALVTANIMLANNICDLEKDIAVKRFTLPFFIGKKALYLFAVIYYLCYLSLIVMVIAKILSPICLCLVLTLYFVQKNINRFWIEQKKEKTFIVSIQNFVLIMASITILIFISGLVR